MAEPEKPSPEIPLQEAVDRGLIPCSKCGARGADVRQVEGKPHFLCARCGGGSRRKILFLAALGGAAIVVVVAFILRSEPEPDEWLRVTLDLMSNKQYHEAMARISERLKDESAPPGVHGLMGQCLMNLSRHDEALPSFRRAAGGEPEKAPLWGVWIGLALQKIGHSAEALPLLQEATPLPPLERMRLAGLLECLLDLERFDEALLGLDPEAKSGGHLVARHRALSYLGRTKEAHQLLEGLGPRQRGTLLASELREAGDFAAAFKEVETLREGEPPLSPQWISSARSELSVCVEAGDLERLERVAAELARAAEPQPRGTAILYRVLGRLLAGKKDEAKPFATEFLASTEATYSPLRLERMMMRHLLGELKDADLDAEARKVSRFQANDLYFYLALATGDRAWAKKAAEATPGRNFPYHAVRRLLQE